MNVPLFYFALGVLLGGFVMGLLGAAWVGTLVQRSQRQIATRLDAHAQRQAAHSAAFARWQAEHERLQQRHAEQLRVLLQAVEQRPAAAAPPPAVRAARPPEWTSAPLARPDAARRQSAPPARELSDEEIDALPPELPVPGKPRKRILPAPKKPPRLGI